MQKDYLEELINYALDHPEEKLIKEIMVDKADGRYFITTSGKAISLCGSKAIELVGNDNGKGYLQIVIGGKSYYLHQLVANAFLLYDKEDKAIIHHLDRNRSNNYLSNLLPLTVKEHNKIHKYLNKWESLDTIRLDQDEE